MRSKMQVEHNQSERGEHPKWLTDASGLQLLSNPQALARLTDLECTC